jgi:hypothetical protein
VNIELIDDPELVSRLGQSSGPRTRDVLHLSDIYKSLMKQVQPKRFDKRDKAGAPLPMDMNKVETGLLFENMLERSLAEKFATVRPGEVVSDEGVYMTPDGVNPVSMAGEEYKCTWMSTRNKYGTTPYTDEDGAPNVKFLHWFIQMKGYAKWLGTDTFLLRALHINGNYEHPYEPTFLTHRIQFGQAEIDENWRMLMNHARNERML